MNVDYGLAQADAAWTRRPHIGDGDWSWLCRGAHNISYRAILNPIDSHYESSSFAVYSPPLAHGAVATTPRTGSGDRPTLRFIGRAVLTNLNKLCLK